MVLEGTSEKNSNLEKKYIEHPLIKEKTIERRTYQEVMVAQGLKNNLLCVLPTGLGKTPIAIILSAYRLEKFPELKILMLAPTKPLVEQHKKVFGNTLNLNEKNLYVLTGKIPPKERKKLWKEGTIFFATPQVVENDIISNRLDLKDFSLLIFDECHRAVKDYAYVFIAENYIKCAEKPRILGLTASPGGEQEKIEEVAKNLFIDAFEIRTDEDPDVKKYIRQKEVFWVKVPLSRNFERIKTNLEESFKSRIKELKDLGIISSVVGIKKRDLLTLRGSVLSMLSNEGNPKLYKSLSIIAACIKIQYALELLQTQGVFPLYKYLEKLKKEKSKAAKSLVKDQKMGNVFAIAEWMYNNNKEHPKLEKLEEIVKGLKGKAIIFTQYRNTVDLIFNRLKNYESLRLAKFKGQKEGFTQKRQLEILDKFREGKYNILISTSVGEEGLDIPDVDLVVFYEPIPSEIRSIQRRGRTARSKPGKIYILIAENTIDEAYYWSSYHREKEMINALKNLKDISLDMEGKKQKSLDFFMNSGKVVIYCDDRERKLIKELSKTEAIIRPLRLEVADFIISDRVAIERKSASDFISSIFDHRLFSQIKALKEQFELPVLIIEGKSFYEREVHPNALWGAIASITLDYQVPIIWTSDLKETVEVLSSLAKREQIHLKRPFSIRGEKKPMNLAELQKFIVSGLPNINTLLSERLLKHFGSIKNVFNASETELKRVKGVGKEKAKKIIDIINKTYEGD